MVCACAPTNRLPSRQANRRTFIATPSSLELSNCRGRTRGLGPLENCIPPQNRSPTGFLLVYRQPPITLQMCWLLASRWQGSRIGNSRRRARLSCRRVRTCDRARPSRKTHVLLPIMSRQSRGISRSVARCMHRAQLDGWSICDSYFPRLEQRKVVLAIPICGSGRSFQAIRPSA